jgi:hypothetical protein
MSQGGFGSELKLVIVISFKPKLVALSDGLRVFDFQRFSHF